MEKIAIQHQKGFHQGSLQDAGVQKNNEGEAEQDNYNIERRE